MVLHFHKDSVALSFDSNRRSLAVGVPMDVGEALLDEAKDHQLYVLVNSSKVFRNFQ